jgi:hypothetical protein
VEFKRYSMMLCDTDMVGTCHHTIADTHSVYNTISKQLVQASNFDDGVSRWFKCNECAPLLQNADSGREIQEFCPSHQILL